MGHEAKQKASEIDKKAREEFNINKMQQVKEGREKARREYALKMKKIETQRAIDRSHAINAARLNKVAERTTCLDEAVQTVRSKCEVLTKDQKKYKALLCDLIVQGCLRLLESTVTVRCRKCDEAAVKSVLAEAQQKYSQVIKAQTGAARDVTLSIDSKFTPDKKSIGGVILFCHNGLISVDNSLDTRLSLVEEQDKPAIRSILFK